MTEQSNKRRLKVTKRTIITDDNNNILETSGTGTSYTAPDKLPDAVEEVKTEEVKIPSNFNPVKLWSSGIYSHGIEDSLHIRPLFLADVLKISSAVQTDNFEAFAEVIEGAIFEDISVKKLPQKDFEGILYWLRMNSMFLEKYSVDFICDSLDHVTKVENKILKAETLIQPVELSTSNFEESHVDEDIFKMISLLQSDIQEMCGVTMDTQTVQSAMEYSEVLTHRETVLKESLKSKQPDVDDETIYSEVMQLLTIDEILKTSLKCSFISSIHGETLKERTNNLINNERITRAALNKMDDYIDYVDEAIGVKETIKHNCEVCSAELVTSVAFSALDFLP